MVTRGRMQNQATYAMANTGLVFDPRIDRRRMRVDLQSFDFLDG